MRVIVMPAAWKFESLKLGNAMLIALGGQTVLSESPLIGA